MRVSDLPEMGVPVSKPEFMGMLARAYKDSTHSSSEVKRSHTVYQEDNSIFSSSQMFTQPEVPSCGRVLIASNLSALGADPHVLFRLFGVYGNVMRVKVMFKLNASGARDTALIEMEDSDQAL